MTLCVQQSKPRGIERPDEKASLITAHACMERTDGSTQAEEDGWPTLPFPRRPWSRPPHDRGQERREELGSAQNRDPQIDANESEENAALTTHPIR